MAAVTTAGEASVRPSPDTVEGKVQKQSVREVLGIIAHDFQAKIVSHLAPRYGLDLRSVALFRVGLALLILTDLFWRAHDLRAHYTDVGLMPRERLLGAWNSPLNYSLHNWGGDVLSQTVLFSVAAGFAFMLLVGFKSRLAAFLSWLFLASLQGRNYLILQGGDDMLRVMLFWSMFLPLGARFSVDAVLALGSLKSPLPAASERPIVPRRVFSLASMVVVLQLFAVYVVTAYLKDGPAWTTQGSAIHLALHHHTFATRTGILMRQLPAEVLQFGTWAVWWLELLGPFLFFLPWQTHRSRTLQVFLFWGFHFGLFMTMELGPFPWVAMVCWCVALPTWFWDVPVRQSARALRLRRWWFAFSERLLAWIYRQRRWLPEPGVALAKNNIAVLCVLFGLASYTAYGTWYAALHRGAVHGKVFEPLIMIRLYANWGMFAPNPPNTSGWFVTVAKQKNGNEIDVWNGGGPVSWDPPELPSTTYKRERWRKLGDNLLSEHHKVVRPYFLEWWCTDWNEDHAGDEQIESIELYHMVQTVHFPRSAYTPLEKKLLQKHQCKKK